MGRNILAIKNYAFLDKSKGVGLRVGGGDGWPWWAENGDNCIWTTIKKKNYVFQFVCAYIELNNKSTDKSNKLIFF